MSCAHHERVEVSRSFHYKRSLCKLAAPQLGKLPVALCSNLLNFEAHTPNPRLISPSLGVLAKLHMASNARRFDVLGGGSEFREYPKTLNPKPIPGGEGASNPGPPHFLPGRAPVDEAELRDVRVGATAMACDGPNP